MTLSSCCGEMRAEQWEGGSGGREKARPRARKREKERERERERERTGAIVILSHYHLD